MGPGGGRPAAAPRPRGRRDLLRQRSDRAGGRGRAAGRRAAGARGHRHRWLRQLGTDGARRRPAADQRGHVPGGRRPRRRRGPAGDHRRCARPGRADRSVPAGGPRVERAWLEMGAGAVRRWSGRAGSCVTHTVKGGFPGQRRGAGATRNASDTEGVRDEDDGVNARTRTLPGPAAARADARTVPRTPPARADARTVPRTTPAGADARALPRAAATRAGSVAAAAGAHAGTAAARARAGAPRPHSRPIHTADAAGPRAAARLAGRARGRVPQPGKWAREERRMRVARLYGVGDIRVSDEAAPEPGPGERLVQVTAV